MLTTQTKSLQFAALSILMIVACAAGYAQPPEELEIPPDAAPPPLKLLSKLEREQLQKVTKVQDRVKLALEMMDTRVTIAEKYIPQEQFEMVFRELGGFHALLDDTLNFLQSSDTNQKRVVDNFKRFEIGLRRISPRLELIRREMSPQREYYLRMLLREVREARAKAVEPLFGNIGERQSGN